jgi:hypothetical protein
MTCDEFFNTMDWILELCPEIQAWQAEIIAEHMEDRVAAECEACAVICDSEATIEGIAQKCAAAIRARSQS